MTQPLTPKHLAERLERYHRAARRWPMEEELPAYLRRPGPEVAACIDALVQEQRFMRRSGMVVPWESTAAPAPRPVVVEPTQAPPPKPPTKPVTKCRRPRVNWPPDAELVAMADRLKAEGERWAVIMAAELNCRPQTIPSKVSAARTRLAKVAAQPAAVEPPDDPDPEPHVKEDSPQEVERMPKTIEWPPIAEFLALVEEYQNVHKGEWAIRLARQLKCRSSSVRRHFNELRRRPPQAPTMQPLTVQPAAESTAPDSSDVSPPVATAEPGEGVGGPQDGMAQNEPTSPAGARIKVEPVKVTFPQTFIPLPTEFLESMLLAECEAYPWLLTWTGRTSSASTLATHATLILVDESDEYPAQVRVVHEQLTQAPDQIGDQWGEAVRVDGLRTIRIWICVGRLEVQGAPLCVMMLQDAAVVRAETRERGAA